MSGRGAVRTGKGINLSISNEYMDDIIRIIKTLENSRVLIDWNSQTVKRRIEKQGGLLGILLRTLYNSVLEIMLTKKGVMTALRVETGYNKMSNISKLFYFHFIF